MAIPAFHRDRRVSEPSTPPERYPRDGDVVVARESHSRVHYTLRQLPGIVQFTAAGRDEAVRLARAFGQRYAVNVWYSEAGTCRLLEAYRPRTPRASAVRNLVSKD
jgi:hypothetical protein